MFILKGLLEGTRTLDLMTLAPSSPGREEGFIRPYASEPGVDASLCPLRDTPLIYWTFYTLGKECRPLLVRPNPLSVQQVLLTSSSETFGHQRFVLTLLS